MLGVSTGGRSSELLSLRIGDVYQNGKPVSDLLYNRSIVKGGEVSRAVPVNINGRDAIEDLIDWHPEKCEQIALGAEPYRRIQFLLGSLKKEADEHFSLNSHAADTTSPVSGTTQLPPRSSRSHKTKSM